jgi:hypothetical protein
MKTSTWTLLPLSFSYHNQKPQSDFIFYDILQPGILPSLHIGEAVEPDLGF